jgi:hypothetical protein
MLETRAGELVLAIHEKPACHCWRTAGNQPISHPFGGSKMSQY